MNKKQNKKPITYVFIDATNIIYGASDHKWKMDFKKLFKYLKTKYNAKKVFYYAGVDDQNKKQLGFYEKLQEFGYLLRLVPVKRFLDGTVKADVDSRMTFEIMKYYDTYTQAVVMTGDGDFYWVLEYLLENHKKLNLLAFNTSTARELKQLVKGKFTALNRLKNKLEFKQ